MTRQLIPQLEVGRHRRAPEEGVSYREVFAVGEFRWLWIAQVVSFAGDLFPRRQMMIACDLARVVLVGLMAVRGMPVWALCTLLFGTVLLSAPFSSARSALVADILSENQLPIGSAIGNIPTRRARSSDSSPAPPWSPRSAATGRWASTRLRSEYQLLFS